MSEISGVAITGTMVLEEPEGGGTSVGGEQASAPEPGNLHCGSALWPRPQTWLCVVPLSIGFVGLGLSLMLLKWIVVGSVQDYVPTDLVDAKGIGQDPIFLSKPSTIPKNPHTTTSSGSPTVRVQSRPGTHPSAVPNLVPSHRTPHLHNRISTRLTTTTTTCSPHSQPPAGQDVTPRSTTVRRTGPGNGRNSTPSSTRVAPPSSSPSPSNHPFLHGTTRTWNRDRSSKGPSVTPTQPHLHVKTVAPTSPSLHSEHFKPCKDKDLAYCLNDGECFVIQTMTGSNKHCRCKEGYQGIRCNHFLPKTDSILSDPESKEVYKRQVLSISCIAIGISLLGTLCMAFYCQNMRRREKLQTHLKVSCSLKTPNHDKDPGSSPPRGGAVCGSGFPQNCPAPPTYPKALPTKKQSRSSSLSNRSGQRNRVTHHQTASRRTPPISRGRLNPIGGFRDSSHAYQHLQEVEDSEKEVPSLTVHNYRKAESDNVQDGNFDVQQGGRGLDRWADMGVQFNHLERATLLHQAPPLSLRTCSVPIIPSFQGQDVISYIQENSLGEEGKTNPRGTCPPAAPSVTGSGGQAEGPGEALPQANRKQEDKTDSFLTPARGRAEGPKMNFPEVD
ncbi:pro-neuregulin-3, membrane-bound isoform-like isoform X2 [Anguilla anguilla]|uniref:pro-neuregulin-3, membrane-bound isoform-like isoform X2 n=1 Tax=Anguilla anguilla TaxID=7936 RepID=UPI0015ACEE54|nr:pro-neuregulin-3, membrane-bound isoform-like isoform X2 [Anguilla anguilla]